MSDRDARRKVVLDAVNGTLSRQGVEIFPAAAERVLDALDEHDAQQGTEKPS